MNIRVGIKRVLYEREHRKRCIPIHTENKTNHRTINLAVCLFALTTYIPLTKCPT
jgi:hypothetical protein